METTQPVRPWPPEAVARANATRHSPVVQLLLGIHLLAAGLCAYWLTLFVAGDSLRLPSWLPEAWAFPAVAGTGLVYAFASWCLATQRRAGLWVAGGLGAAGVVLGLAGVPAVNAVAGALILLAATRPSARATLTRPLRAPR
jgi:hypothetical protein